MINTSEIDAAIKQDFEVKSSISRYLQTLKDKQTIFTDSNILKIRYMATVWAAQPHLDFDTETLLMNSKLA